MKLWVTALALLAGAAPAAADRVSNPIAVFAGLDKITGLTTTFETKIGEEKRFGGLIVKADACYTRDITEEPRTTSFVEVEEIEPDDTRKKIFSGWKNDPSAVEKISTGATAKWTLASYAERNRDLLSLYRAEYERQPKEIAQPLRDVIMSAEVFESEKIRKDQFGAIEDAHKMKATNEAGMSKGATAGSIAIATGCVAASALGQIYIAVPCVIGGALFTGAMKLMH